MNFNSMRAFFALALCFVAAPLIAGENESQHQDFGKKIKVTNTKDHGRGSLRCAIEKANRLQCPTHIVFDLDKSDCGYDAEQKIWVIKLESSLEVTGDEVTLDALSQKGSRPNTNPIEKCNNARYKVVIEGPDFPVEAAAFAKAAIVGFDGIRILGARARVQGLVLNNFPVPGTAALNVQGRDAFILQNFLGTDHRGSSLLPLRPNAASAAAVSIPRPTFTALWLAGSGARVRNILAGGLGGAISDNASAKAKAAIFLPAWGVITNTAFGSSIRLSTVGITAVGSKALTNRGVFGIVHSPLLDNAAAAKATEDETDLLVEDSIVSSFGAQDSDSDAAFLGANIRVFAFRNIVLNRLTVGTDRTASFALLGNGNGLELSQDFVPADVKAAALPFGTLTVTNSLFSGHIRGLSLNVPTTGGTAAAAAVNPIAAITLRSVLIGTNKAGTLAIPNVTGAVSSNHQTLSVFGSVVSGNTQGWIHLPEVTDSAASDKAVIGQTVLFNDNFFGVTRTGAALPNTGIGLQLLAPTVNPVQLNNNTNSNNDVGVVVARVASVLTSPANLVSKNIRNNWDINNV